MRAAFVKTLLKRAEDDSRIFLIVGDVGYSLVEPFAEKFPERFLNAGIAEQNMTGIAAGLSLCGKVVFTYSLANFPTIRCLEQIRNDLCYHNANVKIAASGGGLMYGTLGATHHVTEDLAIMRALPGMTVIAPGDPVETAAATEAAVNWPGPCYLRLGRTGDPVIHKAAPDFQIGKAITVRDGGDVTLISTGSILGNTLLAAEHLAHHGIQSRMLSMHTLKPLDIDAVLKAAQDTGAIVTIEEHSLIGGLGSAVAEVLAEHSHPEIAFRRIGINDRFCSEVGKQEQLLKGFSLSSDGIATVVESLVQAR